MSTLQQNWRKGQNTFCLEARGMERRGGHGGAGGRNGPNNVCTYESINKKCKKIELSYGSATSLPGIYLKECELSNNKGSCILMYIAALFTIAKQ
jgi:hypothetical protein